MSLNRCYSSCFPPAGFLLLVSLLLLAKADLERVATAPREAAEARRRADFTPEAAAARVAILRADVARPVGSRRRRTPPNAARAVACTVEVAVARARTVAGSLARSRRRRQ